MFQRQRERESWCCCSGWTRMQHCDVGLVGGAHERVTVLRLYCLGRHLRLNVLSSDMVDTRPHRRPVCGSTGGNTASVSLWCANIKAASEPLVTEKKVYLKIKLYPSLSRTEKSTRWPCVFIPPPSGSSAAERRMRNWFNHRDSQCWGSETDMVDVPVLRNTQPTPL